MSNYTKNNYVDDKNNSWSIVFELIEDNQTILDIGCSSGNFGSELIERKGCTVDGIDIDDKDVKLANERLRNAQVLDIENDNLDHLHGKYDTILLMDVIEHLVRPVQTLQKISKLLKPKGRLIFSVPNMAHISVRLDLLSGDLEYRKTGLLDETHLHFYSQKTLLKVLRSANYLVNTTRSTTVTYPKQLIAQKLKEVGLEYSTKFNKGIEATNGNVYQMIGVAHPAQTKNTTYHTFPENNPHEEHFLQIEKAINDQQQHIKNLENSLRLKDKQIKNLDERIQYFTNLKIYKLARIPASSLRKIKTVIKNQKGK
jgi:2-polyprenyl-3-methyl-5-hydroxy-6-metoxy-1,4-benzoquinol methylase